MVCVSPRATRQDPVSTTHLCKQGKATQMSFPNRQCHSKLATAPGLAIRKSGTSNLVLRMCAHLAHDVSRASAGELTSILQNSEALTVPGPILSASPEPYLSGLRVKFVAVALHTWGQSVIFIFKGNIRRNIGSPKRVI